MTEQEPLIRNANFDEVNIGLPEKVALLESERCLLCKDPKCMTGCPVGVRIPRFIELLSQGNLAEAAHCLLSDNALPAVTGRVCPQETQCEIECIRGHKGLPVACAVKERGGLIIVQDPRTAPYPSMPKNALRAVKVDYCVPLAEIAGLLAKLVHEDTTLPALTAVGG
jgi:glutamate synthase (NADPH/NADH) small chain